jgi:hypothetical protein
MCLFHHISPVQLAVSADEMLNEADQAGGIVEETVYVRSLHSL